MRRKNYWNVLLLAAAGAVLMAGCSQKDSTPASSAAAGDTQAAGDMDDFFHDKPDAVLVSGIHQKISVQFYFVNLQISQNVQ